MPSAHEVARRHVLLLRLPGLEQVEETSVAVELHGFYILDSWENLAHPSTAPQGIAVCDSVLVCK
ncbi:hypothetical protein [Streptomyces sp. NPDC054834]